MSPLLSEVQFFCFLSYWHQPTTRNLEKPSWNHFLFFSSFKFCVQSTVTCHQFYMCSHSLTSTPFSCILSFVSCSLLSFLLWKSVEDCDLTAASSLPSSSSPTKPQNNHEKPAVFIEAVCHCRVVGLVRLFSTTLTEGGFHSSVLGTYIVSVLTWMWRDSLFKEEQTKLPKSNLREGNGIVLWFVPIRHCYGLVIILHSIGN